MPRRGQKGMAVSVTAWQGSDNTKYEVYGSVKTEVKVKYSYRTRVEVYNSGTMGEKT